MYIINATFPKLLSRCVMALETHKAPNIYVNKSILHFSIFFNLSWFKNNGSNINVNKNCIKDVTITPPLKNIAGPKKSIIKNNK